MSGPIYVRVEVSLGTHRWMGQGTDLLIALDGLKGVLADVDSDDESMRRVHNAIAAGEFRVRIESDARWWNPASWGRSTLHIERLSGHIYRVVQ